MLKLAIGLIFTIIGLVDILFLEHVTSSFALIFLGIGFCTAFTMERLQNNEEHQPNRPLSILAIIASILLIATFVKQKVHEQNPDLLDRLQIESIFAKDFNKKEIHKIEFYRGNQPENKIIIEKQQENWVLPTAHKAQANFTKISKLLHVFEGLEGELRSKITKNHENFSVTEEMALHVKMYSDSPDLKYYLLVGKQPRGGSSESCFVRNFDSKEVYWVAEDLPHKFHTQRNHLKQDDWLQTAVLKISKNNIRKISLTYPETTLEFTREKKIKRRGKRSKKEVLEWKITQGDIGRALKPEKIRLLAEALSKFEIAAIANPKDREKLGLDQPNYQITILLTDKSFRKITLRTKKDEQGAYCTLNNRPGLIYKVAQWQFAKVLPKPTDFFGEEEKKEK